VKLVAFSCFSFREIIGSLKLKTTTTILHEAGVPAAVAQALIGHDSEAMQELYASVGREALQRALASLPDSVDFNQNSAKAEM
jgi:hypothetical protein